MMTTGQTRATGRWHDGAAMNDLPAGAPRAAGASSTLERLKGAAPMAAAGLAIVTGLVAVSLTSPDSTPSGASTLETPPAATAPPQPAAGQPQASGPGPAVPGVAFDQAPGAGPPAMGVELVVKFKDDGRIKDIVDAFWRDPASARSRFEAFRAGKAEFSGLTLERVTYSNELVLVSTDAGLRLPAMREIAAKVSGHPDVAYAEPNMTAQPGAR